MNVSVCLSKVPVQIFNIGPSYNVMSKIGELIVILFQNSIFSISTFHRMKTKTYIQQNASLHYDLMNAHSKFEQNMWDWD